MTTLRFAFLIAFAGACGPTAQQKTDQAPKPREQVIPPGTGWSCISDTDGAADHTCHRGDEECQQTGRMTDADGSTTPATCVAATTAWCLTYHNGGYDHFVCYDNQPACDRLIPQLHPDRGEIAPCTEHR